MKKRRPEPKKTFRKTFIREWRKHRNLTLGDVMERLAAMYEFETTEASLSRIERGEQPYSQEILEALADALGTTPANLIMHPPGAEDELRLVWAQLSPAKRKEALSILRIMKESAA